MRHYKRGRKLGTDASHTKAIKQNLVVALFTYDRIKTTLERAKEIRGDVDRIITWAKRGDVHSRRLAIAKLGNKDLVAEIFAKVEQGLFEGREGGYTRIMKIGKRRGDGATVVIMELVQEPVSPKRRDDDDSASSSGRRGLRGLGRRNRDSGDADEVEETTVDEAADDAAEVDEDAADADADADEDAADAGGADEEVEDFDVDATEDADAKDLTKSEPADADADEDAADAGGAGDTVADDDESESDETEAVDDVAEADEADREDANDDEDS